MIIHQPELLKKNGQTVLYSRIEMRQRPENFPEHAWYRVPDQFAEHLSMHSDAFLIPGLLAGMYFKEDIEVRGTISPRLAYHLEEYQKLLFYRNSKVVTPVQIKYAQLKPLQAKPRGVGSTFSGGVDSFYTLWEHLPMNQPIPEFQVTHALFIFGFDIIKKNKQKYTALHTRFSDVLRNLNIELIPLETNINSIIISRMFFPHFYGPILIGTAHVFGKLFNKFYIPNSNDFWQNLNWTSSSNPGSDPLLSSDTMEIIHHGVVTRRVEKVEALSDWEPFQKNLRVCSQQQVSGQVLNCGRCEKCVRTMIPIYALRKMDQFTTFNKPISSNHDYLWWARKFNPKMDYVKEFFPFIRRVNPELTPWLRIAALAGYIRYWVVKRVPKFVQHWLTRFGYFTPDPKMEKNAYEDPELVELLKAKQASFLSKET